MYDFIIQVVPPASPFLRSPQYVELIGSSDLVLLYYILVWFRVLNLRYMSLGRISSSLLLPRMCANAVLPLITCLFEVVSQII